MRDLLSQSEREETAAADEHEEITGLHTVDALQRAPLPSTPEIHVHVAHAKSDPKSLRESVRSTGWAGIAAAIVALAGLVTAIAKAAIDLAGVMH